MQRMFIRKAFFCLLLTGPVSLKQMVAQIAPPAPYTFTSKPNRVTTTDALVPLTDSAALAASPIRSASVSAIYYDGLGRMLQTVGKKASLATNPSDLTASAQAKDMVHTAVYDGFGRPYIHYLPFAANTASGNTSVSDGGFKNNPFQQQQSFMQQQYGSQGDTYFYTLTRYDASPLNEAVEAFAPGNSWAGTAGNVTASQRRSVKTSRFINTLADSVRMWRVTDSLEKFGGYTVTGIYPAGTLYKTVTTDEQGQQSVEFKDKSGKVVLLKIQDGSLSDDGPGKGHAGWKCTYYIFDKFERIRALVQPIGVSSLLASGWAVTASVLEGFFFRYEYDTEGRLVMEKVPSAGASRMVYDIRGRLVMYQNVALATAGKWSVTVYDSQDRPVRAGLLLNTYNGKTFYQHLQAAADSLGYPFPATAVPSATYWETLTVSGYDDYTTLPAVTGITSTLDATYTSTSYISYPFNMAPEYALPCQQGSQTRGTLTWTQVKVLGSSPEQFITSVYIYDKDGRLIQGKAKNISGGVDITTTQYSWNGSPIRTVTKNEKSGTNPQTSITATKITYDDLWRSIKTEVRTSHTTVSSGVLSPWTVTSTVVYDALGQAVTKNIGNKRPSYDGSQPLQKSDLEYNIRGWLLSSNKQFVLGTNNTDRYFGFETAFDKNPSLGSGTAQYTGSVSAVLWKSEGDKERRRFNYTYDASGQLASSLFGQYVSGTGASALFNTSAGLDFSTTGLSYDQNGNIQTLNQRGWKPGGSSVIDSLLYTYYTGTNKLKNVLDRKNDTATTLGDFRSSRIYVNALGGTKTTAATDYLYNDAGMVVKDFNKDIGSSASNGLTYNFLNLQEKVAVFSSAGLEIGSITYVYDANGSKLKKTIKEPGKADMVYLYAAGSLYLNDTLQFQTHSEGRIRYTPASGAAVARLDFDYMLTDHLGNVRMVLTEELQQDVYPILTLEGATAPEMSEQNKYWENQSGQSLNIGTVRVTRPGSFGTPGANGSYALLARKSTGPIGAAKLVRVMSGDRLQTAVEYYYTVAGSNNSGANGIGSLVANFAQALLSGSTVGAPLKAASSQLVSSLGSTASLSSLLNTPAQQSGSNQAPKAYLNILFFDEQFRFDSTASIVLPVGYTPGTKGTLSRLAAEAAVAKKNGYAYVYVSNETDEMVYFDNFMLSHERGPILEETHYYPFSLPIATISSKAAGKMANRFKGNMGSELDTELNLQMYETDNRMYDPQIGRFHAPDPLAKEYGSFSPYSFAFNDPVYWADPRGAENYSWEQLLSQIENGTVKAGHYYSSEGNTFGFQEITNFRYDAESDKLWIYTGRKVDVTLDDAMSDGNMATITANKAQSHSVGAKYRHFDPGLSSIIPVYGAAMAAQDAFIKGHWGWGIFHSAMAVSDLFMVKSLVTSAGKLIIKGIAKKAVAETGLSYTGSGARSFANHGGEFLDDGLRMIDQPLVTNPYSSYGFQSLNHVDDVKGVSGLYIFDDATRGMLPYVGKSNVSIATRLMSHSNGGRIGGQIYFKPLTGSTTFLEVQETIMMNNLGGKLGTANKVFSVSPARNLKLNLGITNY